MDSSSTSRLKEKSSRITGLLAKKSAKNSKRLKLYTDEDSLRKNTVNQLLVKVLEASKERLWRNHEIIYWVLLSSESKKLGLTKKRSEKHLYVFHNADQSSAYLVTVVCRGKDIDIKQSWNMSDIKSVNSGLSANEFVFSAEEKFSWQVSSNVLRDEAVWVLVHVCKYLCENDVKFYSNDIQDLQSAIASNGTLSKFPALKQALDVGMEGKESLSASGTDVLAFTAEETDAERLFDEMQWGASGTEGSADPALLQGMLKTETDTLHIEICDFLLQWEEEGEEGEGGSADRPTVTSKTRETLELLNVLDSVDRELGCVDEWLTGQIDYLADVQSELFQIEAENGALETSWHNLSAVKIMITQLLDGPLSLKEEHESILRAPLAVVQAALADRDLSHTADILQPLVEALQSLRCGLDAVNGKNSFDPAQWERLQTMLAVFHQRQKLIELTELVCHELIDFVATLFKNILQHKAINNPSRTESNSSTGRTILVRKFSFSSITNKVKEQQGRFLVETAGEASSSTGSDVEHRLDSNEFVGLKNQLQSAQRTFHNAVLPFLPVLKNVSSLSPSLAESIQITYTESSSAHFYQPLFKLMFTELFASIPHRQNPVFSLSTAPRSQARKRTNPSLRFQHPSLCRSGAVLVLSPWTVLAVAMSMLEDVVSHEDEFTGQLMICVGDRQTVHRTEEARAASISKQFSVFKEKIMKLVTSSEYADGIEVVAMMATVDMLIVNHEQCLLDKVAAIVSDPGHTYRSGGHLSSSLDIIGTLLESVRSVLGSRLNEFLTSQITWIKHSREDTKRSTVLTPFLKFPSFIDQLKEFSGDKRLEYIDNIMVTLGRELLTWLHETALLNEKYYHVTVIHNLEFFVQSLGVRNDMPALHRLSGQAAEKKVESEKKYVEWMVSYEFPVFAGLADRVRELGRRAGQEEMGLYIRRDEVSRAVTKMDKRTIEASIVAIRKRLDKHFQGFAEVTGLHVVAALWTMIQNEICKVFQIIETVARSSYQIELIVNEKDVKSICEKHVG